MERGLEIERDGEMDWRKRSRSREMEESSASMGEEELRLRQLDVGFFVNK